jgi:hypothetical protein
VYGGGSVRAWRARMVAATGGTVAVPRGGTWGDDTAAIGNQSRALLWR